MLILRKLHLLFVVFLALFGARSASSGIDNAYVTAAVDIVGREQGLYSQIAGFLSIDNAGYVWVPLDKAVLRFNGSSFEDTSFHENVANNDKFLVPYVFQTKEGEYWFTSSSTGVYRYNPTTGEAVSYRPNINDPNS